MKLIAVVGKSNSGKTSSIKKAMQMLLKKKDASIIYCSKYSHITKNIDVINQIDKDFNTPKGYVSDITMIIKIKGKNILITSQGDSVHDLKNMYRNLKKKHKLDFFICGRHDKEKVKVEFKGISDNKEYLFVEKNREEDKNKREVANLKTGEDILKIIIDI